MIQPQQFAVIRTVQGTAVPPVNLQQLRRHPGEHAVIDQSPIPTPGRTLATAPLIAGHSGACPSGPPKRQVLPGAQQRMPSPEAGSLRLITGGQQSAGPSTTHPSAAALLQNNLAYTGSTPVLGRGSFGHGVSPYTPGQVPPGAPPSARSVSGSGNRQTLEKTAEPHRFCEVLFNQLHLRVQQSQQDREQELRKQLHELKEMEDLFLRAKEEVQEVLHRSDGIEEDQMGLNYRRPTPKPPFAWQPSQEYEKEFQVTGESQEIVTKVGDFEDQGWVIPVGGSWRLMRGGIYRWTICIERKCSGRPQLQLGIHGANHNQPWRLVTTSRCSWSRDDEPWQDRPGGDRLIDEGSFVHIEVDMRGINSTTGTFSLAIDDGPFEEFFDDIPLSQPYSLIPVVSMGGNQSRVRLCPNY